MSTSEDFKKEILQEFDDRFGFLFKLDLLGGTRDNFKSFISSALDRQKEEFAEIVKSAELTYLPSLKNINPEVIEFYENAVKETKYAILAALKNSTAEKPQKTSWGPGGKCIKCGTPVEVICPCEVAEFLPIDPTSWPFLLTEKR